MQREKNRTQINCNLLTLLCLGEKVTWLQDQDHSQHLVVISEARDKSFEGNELFAQSVAPSLSKLVLLLPVK